jgi:hypothetical protein
MDPLYIEESNKTPKVSLDAQKGFIEIKGVADEEDALGFFFPVIQWLDAYIKRPAEHTDMELEFKYYNTASAKALYEILKRVAEIHKSGNTVIVKWYYPEGDEHLLSEIETFSDITHMPIQAIEK